MKHCIRELMTNFELTPEKAEELVKEKKIFKCEVTDFHDDENEIVYHTMEQMSLLAIQEMIK